MSGAEATKTVKESRVVLAQHMGVSDSNLAGAVHGGTIMKLVDTAGGLAAMKFSGCPVVTAAIDELSFLEPVNLGDLVTVTASVNGVGDTSMEVGVKVETENVLTGETRHTSTAYLLYVALDAETKQPVRVPRLECETAEERRRQRQAKARRKARTARREATLAARADADEAARRRQEAAEARRQARLAGNKEEPPPAPSEEPVVPEATDSGGEVRKWRRREPEPEPALVGATMSSSEQAADLSKWRRHTR
jgi:acyl-CoA hydrolase